MDRFILHSEYQPTGDQPEAIDALVKGFTEGDQFQTLLGVTGSGKTFTMANVIAKLNKPTLVIAHNKTLAAQLYGEFKEFFPENAVEYFVSYYDYYQPEAYVPSSDTYIEKDSSINDEIDKLRHSATAALTERRDVVIVASVSCIYGLGSPIDYQNMTVSLRPGMIKDRDEVIHRLASMETAAKDFKLIWDDAYCVHHLTDEEVSIPSILAECKEAGHPERPLLFCSTSKITYPGAGVAAVAGSEANVHYITENMMPMVISYDKMNQLRHVQFLKNKEGVLAHMRKHRKILEPKFNLVKKTFTEELNGCGKIARWTDPKGGYFISLYLREGCAKRTVQLCKEAGVVLTGAGAAYPYGIDPRDSHLRIAPTFPSLEELKTATDLLCICVRMATVEQLLREG